MNPILAFLKTTRPVNLAIIAVTMYAMRFFLEGGYLSLLPESVSDQMTNRISETHFLLLTLIMIFLAASGNIINDYFDVKVDRINKPERITIDKGLKRRVAMISHHGLNILAVTMGIYLGYKEKELFYALTPVIIASALWYYSFHLKKTFLLGNVIVALVVSIVPIWATYSTVAEPLLITTDLNNPDFPYLKLYSFYAASIIIYTLQAYAISIFREIAKDAEDVKGDKEFGYRTLPIVWGWSKTKTVLLSFMSAWLVILVGLGYYLLVEFIPVWSILYFIIIVLPFGMSLFSVAKRKISKENFTKCSLWLKITLGAGLIYSGFMPEHMGYLVYHYLH